MPDNQTNEEWLDLPSVAGNANALGTGVVLYQAGGRKDYLADIKYDDLLVKDSKDNYFAFSWVPHVVADFSQVQKTQCGGRCSKTCKRPGCICDRSIGRCR
jgi:hypothetical protein